MYTCSLSQLQLILARTFLACKKEDTKEIIGNHKSKTDRQTDRQIYKTLHRKLNFEHVTTCNMQSLAVTVNVYCYVQWYGSWIYNYLCNQCLSPLMLWVRFSIRARCTTLCDKVCQWLAIGRWFSPGPPVFSTNKTEVLLKVVLSTIKQTNKQTIQTLNSH